MSINIKKWGTGNDVVGMLGNQHGSGEFDKSFSTFERYYTSEIRLFFGALNGLVAVDEAHVLKYPKSLLR